MDKSSGVVVIPPRFAAASSFSGGFEARKARRQ
jgi:hypothetical protein